jgi:hypothetical protein
MDTAKMLGFGDEKLTRLKEILTRARSADDAVDEFRKLGDSKPEYRLAESEEELLRLLNEGWEVEREVGSGRFLMRRR